MSDHSKNRDDESHDEIIAGEYVLGVLSVEERKRVERRLATEPSFASRVQRWQDNLESLDEPYGASGPSGVGYFQSIDAELFGPTRPELVTLRSAMWDSVTFWRGLSLASITMAAGFAIVSIIINQPLVPLKKPIVAKPIAIELNSTPNAVKLVATFDANSGRLRILPVDASTQPPKPLELLMVGPDGMRSLGLLAPSGGGEIVVPLYLRHYFTDGKISLQTGGDCNEAGTACRQKVN